MSKPFRTAPMKDGIRYNSRGEPMTDRPTGPATAAAPWDHPYEGSESWPDACVRCGFVGSYAHTQEFYEKWVFPAMAAGAERARILATLPAALRAEGFVRGVARRYGTFNPTYWDQSAAALIAAIEKELEQ